MKSRSVPALILCALMGLALASPVSALPAKDDNGDETRMKASTFKGLELRGIGPAIASGRVSDIAVHPVDHNTWYVAVASGGVWKTTNAGTTWTPVFDKEGSYSIGCIAIDPKDPLVVWVGTGENNSQRSVSYGDGLYKSIDGGRNWKHVGLKDSEHIGKIVVDPWDSKVVYVASQGPLWSKGGDRGLYKTTDGGGTWERILEIDDYTGVTDVVMDPSDPEVLYAAAYQRFRRVWSLIDGGPGSAIYKSTDAGASWKKLTSGLPKAEMGRIGLAVAPANPDIVYAIIESADDEEEGFYRSTDAGGTWKKVSDYVSGSPQYYQELVPDPHDASRVYSMDTWMMVTEDGGKTFSKVGEKYKHVDNHGMWIDPGDTAHMIAGCDGGVYETFDRGATWRFSANLPVTQFYKLTVDNDAPFYNIYGGTQDNFTIGGPSRTTTVQGIMNQDWYFTLGGDGFQPRVDPTNPDIVYSQWQYGRLHRYDRRSGEIIDIQPMPEPGDAPLKWNWDSALIISPHSPKRLYFGANRLYRSDDRGDTWVPVSPDLTRQLDRNRLEMMERVWSVDAVAKNRSTSFYGNIVALDESPLIEGLIYAGTDDGLIQVTEDGGTTWRKIDRFKGVPDMTYVADILASRHDPTTVFAAFDNHKTGDFKPYLMVSFDRGATWVSLSDELPERGTVYAVEQDHVVPDLLFAGTEFGLFFSIDHGERWVQLKGGLPVIAVRDLAIQQRENDLVLGTFGRGFYVLDDYTPLRRASDDLLGQDVVLFGVKDALAYMPTVPLGLRGKGFQGDAFYTAPNPPFGAVFTYYLRDEIKTLSEQRRDTEKKTAKDAGDVFYPTWDELRREDREEEPAIILTVSDEEGNIVRHLTGPVKAGFHRVAWDLRYPPFEPTSLKPPSDDNPFADPPMGPTAVPGRYWVSLAQRVEGKIVPLSEAQTFSMVPLNLGTLPAESRQGVLAFQEKTGRLLRAVLGAARAADEAQERIDHLRKALMDTPGADPALGAELRALESRLKDLVVDLRGDRTVRSRNEPTLPSITQRVNRIVGGQWTSTSAPTATHRRAYEIASELFVPVLADLQDLVEVDLAGLEDRAEDAGAPWTPGRVPRWAPEQ